MSMKYFTLSALCVLICCMLFALSGTTDLQANHPQIIAQSGISVSPQIMNEIKKREQKHSNHVLQQWQPGAGEKHTIREEAIKRENNHRRLIRLFGIFFVAGWIFLSFKLLSTD